MPKVVVGLSGGVDSSVAAYLLKQQGYDVTGVFMQNWEDDDTDEYCSIKQDSLDAITVAEQIGIDIDIVNFAAEYKERVFSYFLAEYQNGRTPNPDILCNSEIKFKAFLEHALKLGADFIATGHYVRKEQLEIPGNVISDSIRDSAHDNIEEKYLYKSVSYDKPLESGESLARAVDLNKDQSYFLYRLGQEQIKRAIFPLGNLTKPEVRTIAAQMGLTTAHKKDSTGICFIGERPFREFLKKYIPIKPGNMVTPSGKIMGEHIGLMYYTIGQRKGIGIGGLGLPWFVAGKDIAKNQLIVVQGHDDPHLLRHELLANNLSFGLHKLPDVGKSYTAKVRYRMQDAKCSISFEDSNDSGDIGDKNMQVLFETPQWAITPGQSVVIYDGDLCLGGGVIL